jgi:hypothetical protein
MRRACFLAAVLVATPLPAAVIPTWRVNSITAAATNADPLLAGAVSVSLLITLSSGSQFNVAGLDLHGLTSQGVRLYNAGSGGEPPDPSQIPPNPHYEFDTYVTSPTRRSVVTFAYTGQHAAEFGPERFNAAWGTIPADGSDGLHEIARVTLIGPLIPGVTSVAGGVRSNDEPNVGVAVPALPFAIVPEPMMGGAWVAVALACLRESARRGRRNRHEWNDDRAGSFSGRCAYDGR